MTIQKLTLDPAIPIFFKGSFDLEPIYRSCIQWMKDQEVEFVYETLFKEKEIGPGIVDKEIRLEGSVKLDEFRKWHIKIAIMSWDTKTLEQVGKSGNKMYEGRFQIKFGGSIEIDYQDAYESQTLLIKSMRKMIQKVWNRGNPGLEVGTIAIKYQGLATICKQHLELEVI